MWTQISARRRRRWRWCARIRSWAMTKSASHAARSRSVVATARPRRPVSAASVWSVFHATARPDAVYWPSTTPDRRFWPTKSAPSSRRRPASSRETCRSPTPASPTTRQCSELRSPHTYRRTTNSTGMPPISYRMNIVNVIRVNTSTC